MEKASDEWMDEHEHRDEHEDGLISWIGRRFSLVQALSRELEVCWTFLARLDRSKSFRRFPEKETLVRPSQADKQTVSLLPPPLVRRPSLNLLRPRGLEDHCILPADGRESGRWISRTG